MTHTKTLLLVEDNEGDVEVTKIAFEESGLRCQVDVAHDGVAALDYLAQRHASGGAALPSLILLDINMPRMGGLEFLKNVKRDERFCAIPVLMLTSSDAETDVRRCYALQANCYIIKPSELDRFVEAVRQIGSFWLGLARLPEAG